MNPLSKLGVFAALLGLSPIPHARRYRGKSLCGANGKTREHKRAKSKARRQAIRKARSRR